MASGDTLLVLHPRAFNPPGSNPATLDTIAGASSPTELIDVLDFDATTAEYADWRGYMPASYSGGGITCRIVWSSSGVAGGTDGVTWEGAFRLIAADADDLDTSAHTYDYNAINDDPASAIGETAHASLTFSNGADMDSVTADTDFIFRLRRNVGDAGDTMTGDAELHYVVISET